MKRTPILDTDGNKIFAAIGVGGFVEFTVSASNSKEARDTVKSLRRRSETIEAVRLLRFDDMPSREREFAEHRGGGTPTY
jgi:hypothetical protein